MFHYGNERRSQGNTEAIWVLEEENPNLGVGGNVDNAQQRRVWGAAYYQEPGMIICGFIGRTVFGAVKIKQLGAVWPLPSR